MKNPETIPASLGSYPFGCLVFRQNPPILLRQLAHRQGFEPRALGCGEITALWPTDPREGEHADQAVRLFLLFLTMLSSRVPAVLTQINSFAIDLENAITGSHRSYRQALFDELRSVPIHEGLSLSASSLEHLRNAGFELGSPNLGWNELDSVLEGLLSELSAISRKVA